MMLFHSDPTRATWSPTNKDNEMQSHLKEAVRNLVKYLEHSGEAKDYENSEDKQSHIYNSVLEVKKWLDPQKPNLYSACRQQS
jgi:hypothetical protein